MRLYNKADIISALGDELLYIDGNKEFLIENVVFDNREVTKNSLFIARKGEKTDGHNFIKDTLEKSEDAVILAQYLSDGIEMDSRIILVKDTNIAFEKLAIFSRNRFKCPVIGITGSIGKTSTKDAMFSCLSSFGKSFCNQHSFNNYTGVLTTLVNAPEDTEFGIFEMGTSGLGEMEIIEKFVKPDIAIIMNIKQAHLGCFDSEEAIAIEKSKIIGENAKLVVLNAGNKWYDFLRNRADGLVDNILTFGNQGSDVLLLEHTVVDNKAYVSYRIDGKMYDCTFLNIDYNLAYNSQAVLCLVKYFGLDVDLALKGISSAETTRGRNNIEYSSYDYNNKKINLTIINGSYNAVNPVVFVSGLILMDNIFRQGKNKRKVCVWGDILEAGEKTEEFHLKLGKYLLDYKVDVLITFSKYMNILSNSLIGNGIELIRFDDVYEAIKNIKLYLKDEDLVFIKSSKGIKSYEILSFLVKDKMKLFV